MTTTVLTRRRAAAPRRRLKIPTNVAASASAVVASLLVARLVAHGYGSRALILCLAAPAAIVILRRRENALLTATAVILAVPYWLTFGTHQTNVARLTALAALVTIFAGAILSARRAVKWNYVDLAVVGVAAFSLVSWFASAHTPHALQATINSILPLLFYAAARVGDVERRRLVSVVAFGGTLGAVSVLYEYFVATGPVFGTVEGYVWAAKGDLIFRPGGVYGSPPGAATVLAMTALMTLPLVQSAVGLRRAAAVAAVMVQVAAITVTFTRAGMIAVVLGAAVYVALARPRALARGAYVAIGCVLVFAFVFLPRIESTSWYQSGVLRRGDLAIRQSYWRNALPVAVNTPVHLFVGHGINALLVGSPELPGAIAPDIAATPSLATFSPHNQYVRTMVEEGLLGLALVAAWLLGALGAAVGLSRRRGAGGDVEELLVSAACAAAIASFCVVSFADDTLRHIPSMSLVALITGMVASFRAVRDA